MSPADPKENPHVHHEAEAEHQRDKQQVRYVRTLGGLDRRRGVGDLRPAEGHQQEHEGTEKFTERVGQQVLPREPRFPSRRLSHGVDKQPLVRKSSSSRFESASVELGLSSGCIPRCGDRPSLSSAGPAGQPAQPATQRKTPLPKIDKRNQELRAKKKEKKKESVALDRARRWGLSARGGGQAEETRKRNCSTGPHELGGPGGRRAVELHAAKRAVSAAAPHSDVHRATHTSSRRGAKSSTLPPTEKRHVKS
jgi:hypothetical protein